MVMRRIFCGIFVVLLGREVFAKMKSGLCDPREFYEDIPGKPDSYLQCTPWMDQIGEWEEVHCPEGHKFLKELQRCMDRSTYKQQAVAARSRVCRAPRSKASEGTECAWTNETVASDDGNEKGFLQCAPRSRRAACGVWRQVRCPGSSVYSSPLGLCVQSGLRGTCTRGYYAVCRCRGGYYCPSTCSCSRSGTCCTTSVLCPDGQRALTSCSSTSVCPTGFTCINGGCCFSQTSVLRCPDGTTGTRSCVGSGQSTCPIGYSCQTGACCRTTTLPLCSNGLRAIQACTGSGQSTCPQTYQCINGGCCQQQAPVRCPNGQIALQTCVGSGTSTCLAGLTCQNGGCCPAALVTCPNGQLATATCVGSGQSTCPVGFTCQNGGCCLAALPRCPNGQLATATCVGSGQSTCPAGFTCQNGGCCRAALPTCPNGQVATATCVGSGQSTCPTGFTCQNGGCCLAPAVTCPNGQIATQACVGTGQSTCGAGFQCVGGGCCQVQLCPNGNPAAQTCVGTGQSTCLAGFYCSNGGCCRLPLCPNGQPAQQVCTPGGACPGGLVCQNGACCPQQLSTCPDGTRMTGPCTAQGTCSANQYCYPGTNGQGCCPIPNCANGLPAPAPCGNNLPPCPTGLQCVNGGCCPQPLAQCPTGVTATATCTGTGNCQGGLYCYASPNGQRGCCPLPNCANGQLAASACPTGVPCPPGYNCENGFCCQAAVACPNGQAPVQVCSPSGQCPAGSVCIGGQACCPTAGQCPDGSVPTQPCTGTGQGTCAAGFQCVNGGCCAVQLTCPNGGNPVQVCGVGSTCPAGFFCLSSQCCPLPLPICPNGQRATLTCVGIGQSTCQVGFQCFNGGCCPSNLFVDTRTGCPSVQIAVSYCAAFNYKCPPSTTCYSGQCCATTTSQYYGKRRPGQNCSRNRQCSGSPSNARCRRGTCRCTNRSRSDGVTCTSTRVNFDGAKHCGQFGVDCEMYQLTARLEYANGTRSRHHATMDELGIGYRSEPLFWYTSGDAQNECQRNTDCTPDMTCIQRKCRPYLQPGDTKCEFDAQCKGSRGARCYSYRSRPTTNACQCSPDDRQCFRNCPYRSVASYTNEKYCINNLLKASEIDSYSKSLMRARYAMSARETEF